MDSIPFYDQWKLTAPEESEDPPWGTCATCRKDAHLYRGPKTDDDVCNACLTRELLGNA